MAAFLDFYNTRTVLGLIQVGWVAVLRFEQTICSWCGYGTFLPEWASDVRRGGLLIFSTYEVAEDI